MEQRGTRKKAKERSGDLGREVRPGGYEPGADRGPKPERPAAKGRKIGSKEA